MFKILLSIMAIIQFASGAQAGSESDGSEDSDQFSVLTGLKIDI